MPPPSGSKAAQSIHIICLPSPCLLRPQTSWQDGVSAQVHGRTKKHRHGNGATDKATFVFPPFQPWEAQAFLPVPSRPFSLPAACRGCSLGKTARREPLFGSGYYINDSLARQDPYTLHIQTRLPGKAHNHASSGLSLPGSACSGASTASSAASTASSSTFSTGRQLTFTTTSSGSLRMAIPSSTAMSLTRIA